MNTHVDTPHTEISGVEVAGQARNRRSGDTPILPGRAAFSHRDPAPGREHGKRSASGHGV